MFVLSLGCNRLCMEGSPSFNHWNLKGLEPLALHLSLTVWRAGHAINVCCILMESTNLGEAAHEQSSIRWKSTRWRMGSGRERKRRLPYRVTVAKTENNTYLITRNQLFVHFHRLITFLFTKSVSSEIMTQKKWDKTKQSRLTTRARSDLRNREVGLAMRLRLLVFETQRIAGLEAGILLLTEFPLLVLSCSIFLTNWLIQWLWKCNWICCVPNREANYN